MPGMRAHYDDFADMPDGLRTFLLSDAYDERDEEIAKRYALTPDEASAVSDALLNAAFGDLTLSAAVMTLKGKLVPARLAEEQWSAFVSDLFKAQVWPLRDLYESELAEVLQSQGISTSGWPSTRVILKPLSFSGAATEIASMVGFSLVGQMRDRLKDLLLSKSKGIRNDAQVKELLMRSSESAGLGLDAPSADAVLAAMTQLLRTAKILTDEEYAKWLDQETQKAAPLRPQIQQITFSTQDAQDDEEIAAIKAKMADGPKPTSVLDQAVEDIFAKLNGRPEDEYLTKRLRYIISSRLRDVRNATELKQLLQRDTKVGGLGLSKDIAEGITTQIETGYAAFHGKIMDEEKKNLETQVAEQKLKIEERKKREAEEHARWYQEKVLARKEEEAKRAKIAQEMKTAFGTVVGPTTPAHPIDAREARIETEKFGKLVPAVAVGAASPAASRPVAPSSAAGPSIPVSAPMAGSPFAPPAPRVEAHPSVKVSAATVDLQKSAPTIRPRMDDVVASASASASSDGRMRLMGPVEELKGITLSEFRRLSKNPQEAAAKILQKFDVLGQESFERRIEGVKAWMGSPLQGAYMKLVSAALASGKPVIALSEEQTKSGDMNVPTPDEISAILSMNAKLHF